MAEDSLSVAMRSRRKASISSIKISVGCNLRARLKSASTCMRERKMGEQAKKKWREREKGREEEREEQREEEREEERERKRERKRERRIRTIERVKRKEKER